MHYNRLNHGKRRQFRYAPYLLCEACYQALQDAERAVYAACERDCGTPDTCCERCAGAR